MVQADRQRLADLEELSLSIPNQAERQYFNEAVQCYFSGALRAAVVLAWIVTTDNLLGKLGLLAREDGEAAKRLRAVDAKRAADQAYEEELLTSFGPGALDVFTQRELDQLQYVRERRHWCAHATDYRPAPEEARSCLRLVVDIALSKPVFRGFAFVKQLEAEVQDPAFLPARGYAGVVANYLAKLRPELHVRVAHKLIDVALDPAATPTTIENVRRFVGGVLAQTNDLVQLQLLGKELARVVAAGGDLARGLVAHRPEVYEYLEFESRERLFRLVLEGGLSDEDQELLIAFLRTEIRLGRHFDVLTDQLKDKILSLPRLVQQNPAELTQLAFEATVTRLEYLGVNNFAVNNPAAAFLSAVGFNTFDELGSAEKERLVNALIKSAMDGAKTPIALILNAKGWPSSWLELLVNRFPKLVAETGLSVNNHQLITAPLEAWAAAGKPLPASWQRLLVLPPADQPHFPWYSYPDAKLLRRLETIAQAFTDSGHPSAELGAFIARMRDDLSQPEDNIPF